VIAEIPWYVEAPLVTLLWVVTVFIIGAIIAIVFQ
jgi:hypothetical protein